MQLSPSTLIVIVSLMASIVSIASKEEGQNLKIQNVSKTGRSNANEFCTRIMKNPAISRRIRGASEPRTTRMTYVKAVLSNPKMSPSLHLAQKLARVELKSPKMRETFRKLTAIDSPRKKSRAELSRSKIADRRKLSRLKIARRGRRRRKKMRREKGRKGGGKSRDSRRRSARRVPEESPRNGDEIPRGRYGEPIDFRPAGTLENFSRDQSFGDDPYVNLNTGVNYPGVDDFDANSPNFAIDKNNPLTNYGNDYSPIKDRIDDADIADTDVSSANDRSSIDDPTISDVDFAGKFESNDNSRHEAPEIRENDNFPAPRAFGSSSRYSSAVSTFAARGREKNRVSESPKSLDGSSHPENTTEMVLSTTGSSSPATKSSSENKAGVTWRNTSTSASGAGEISRTRKAARDKASDGRATTETSISGGNSTTTRMNPKLREIGEAVVLPLETIDENFSDDSKNIDSHETGNSTEKSVLAYGDNITDVSNETKQVAGQILNRIIEELEDLKIDRNVNNRREGLPCKLSGSWITRMAGVRIDMTVTNRGVNISMAKLDLPVGIIRQGLLNYTWNITGYAPFRRGGPFSIVATDNRTKSLAAFVGACRVCQGVDTIEGVWSIAREPRDCRDFQMATSIHNDIFRRTQLLAAIKEKQSGIADPAKYANASSPLGRNEYSGNARVS